MAVFDEKTGDTVVTWDERSAVLLEQLEAICKKGRAHQLTYMQAIYDIEGLQVGKHLEKRGHGSRIEASRATVLYQDLLEVLTKGRELPGWHDELESLVLGALDIVFFKLHPEDLKSVEKLHGSEIEAGHVADCSDVFYAKATSDALQRAKDLAEAEGKSFGALALIATYPCPRNPELIHCAGNLVSGTDGALPPEDAQRIAAQMRRLADDIDTLSAEEQEAVSEDAAATATE